MKFILKVQNLSIKSIMNLLQCYGVSKCIWFVLMLKLIRSKINGDFFNQISHRVIWFLKTIFIFMQLIFKIKWGDLPNRTLLEVFASYCSVGYYPNDWKSTPGSNPKRNHYLYSIWFLNFILFLFQFISLFQYFLKPTDI